MTRTEIAEMEKDFKALKAKHKTLEKKYKELDSLDVESLEEEVEALRQENEDATEELEKVKKELGQRDFIKTQFGYDDSIELPKKTVETLSEIQKDLTALQDRLNMQKQTLQGIIQTIVNIYDVDLEKYYIKLTPDNRLLTITEKE